MKPPQDSVPTWVCGMPSSSSEANWYCDDYGIDTITTAVIIAFLMECFQRGYLTKEDTGGITLNWGDSQAALRFLHEIPRRKTELASVAGKGMRELIDWVSDTYTRRTGKNGVKKELGAVCHAV